MKHKHHIIPRHIGGSDDPSNLIELSIEEHAKAHRILWEETKNKVSKNRKGKALGKRNSMADANNRKKVSDSKIGRKRVYQSDGSFKYLFPEKNI